jgi:hypothetical protein
MQQRMENRMNADTMQRMYPTKKANYSALVVTAVLFFAGLALVRSQATVDDVAYMRAVIPHHSIAILTSERAQVTDPKGCLVCSGEEVGADFERTEGGTESNRPTSMRHQRTARHMQNGPELRMASQTPQMKTPNR